MLPRRFPPSAPPLPAASGTPPAEASELPTRYGLSNSLPAQTSPRPAAPPDAAPPTRKRLLVLPAMPHPTRPRTDAGLLQAARAAFPRSHTALQQDARALAAQATALGDFGMRWETLDPAHQQVLRAAAGRQERHATLHSIQQTAQDMAMVASQPPSSPRLIEPAMLTANVPAVHYGQMTIDGPHRNAAGQAHFYLEQQDDHACARHAVNAMVGGPLVSLTDFAQLEAQVQGQQDITPAALVQMADDMRKLGVYPETVQSTLESLGIPTHLYAHRPIDHLPGLDPVQVRFLDGLSTDRLLLQVDRYVGRNEGNSTSPNSTSSHYVAFRRDGGQWVLLDSLHSASQNGLSPSAYLLSDEKIGHFMALWPKHPLQGRLPASADRLEHEAADPPGAAGMRTPDGANVRRTVTELRAVEVQKNFLAALAPYAAGKKLSVCKRESGSAGFHSYLTNEGGLRDRGRVLYDKLSPEQQAKVDQAIEARKMKMGPKVMDPRTTTEKFLAALAPYSAGESLADCGRACDWATFDRYISDAGGLQKEGEAIYAKLQPEQQAAVDKAIEARKLVLMEKNLNEESTLVKFMTALEPYAAGKMLKECGDKAELTSFHNYFANAGGLKVRGQALYDKLPPERQAEVDQAIEARTIAMAPKIMIAQSHMDKFVAALAPYAAGELLKDCASVSGLRDFGHFLSDVGLQNRGKALYAKLPSEQQAKVDKAIEDRKLAKVEKAMMQSLTMEQFMEALVPYAAGKTLWKCEQDSGLGGFHNYLVDAGGLKATGQNLYDTLLPEQQAEVDQAIAARKRAAVAKNMDPERPLAKFLVALDLYAAGQNRTKCSEESDFANFHHYFSDAGEIKAQGQALYNKLLPNQRAAVDRAIEARKIALVAKELGTEIMNKFLAGLDPYSTGKTLRKCKDESGLAHFHEYLSDAGEIKKQGQKLYDKLPPEQQAKVDDARLSRTLWFARKNIDSMRFLDSIRRFSSSSLPLAAIEQAAGMKKGHLGLLLCDTGLTEAGRQHIEEVFHPEMQENIHRQIHLRVPPT